MFPAEFAGVYDTIAQAHDKYEKEKFSVAEIQALHFTNHPAMTVAAKNNLEHVFADIEAEENLSEDIAQDVLEKAILRERAREIGNAAIDVINGNSDTLARLGELLNKCSGDSGQNMDAVTALSSDVGDILSGIGISVKWRFNIPTLAKLVPGVGPGLFTIVGARPEAGKTALMTYFVAGPDGFAEQGAKCDYYANEEPGVRTQMRALSAYTGMTEEEVRQNVPKAAEIWDKIRQNINYFDAVALTLEELDALVSARRPDVVVVDQLDKIRIEGSYDKDTDRIRALYTGFREICKRYATAGFGVSQVSADGHGKLNLDFNMLENSKTGKAAEADLIILSGKSDLPEQEYFRQLNLPKNKISGRHEPVNVRIIPHLTRFAV